MQQAASSSAQRRQQQILRESMDQQRQMQMQAEQAALAQAQEFAPEQRAAQQQKIEQEATQRMIDPVERAAPAMQQQAAATGNLSSDYAAARVGANAETSRNAQALAQILGKVTGAGRLRTNEALRMAETGQNIDRLGSFSRGNFQAAQTDASAVRPNGAAMIGGTLLQLGGALGMSGALRGGAGAGSGGNAWVGSDLGMNPLPSVGGTRAPIFGF
ncbi:hypothetical protein [Bordetella avium]|uniref:hypothetical protein n=1 Tax=Bordetella avium TaxID=521 RepID=UPI000FDCBC2C|nr:hypothetical protein [Bordetella avium]